MVFASRAQLSKALRIGRCLCNGSGDGLGLVERQILVHVFIIRFEVGHADPFRSLELDGKIYRLTELIQHVQHAHKGNAKLGIFRIRYLFCRIQLDKILTHRLKLILAHILGIALTREAGNGNREIGQAPD